MGGLNYAISPSHLAFAIFSHCILIVIQLGLECVTLQPTAFLPSITAELSLDAVNLNCVVVVCLGGQQLKLFIVNLIIF